MSTLKGKILKKQTGRERFLQVANTFVENYHIDEENLVAISSLYNYFCVNRELSEGISRDKGYVLMGNFGSGKTLLIKIFREMFNIQIALNRCIDVERDFTKAGPEALDIYEKELNRCFDDLGGEKANSAHYGNKGSVMYDIIQARYELWLKTGLKTFFTTNLTPSEIANKYGERSLSRIKEMCNLVMLGNSKNSTDRRKTAKPLIKTKKQEKNPLNIYQISKSPVMKELSKNLLKEYDVKKRLDL